MTVRSSTDLEKIRTLLKEVLISGQFYDDTLYKIEAGSSEECIDVEKLKKCIKLFLRNNRIAKNKRN